MAAIVALVAIFAVPLFKMLAGLAACASSMHGQVHTAGLLSWHDASVPAAAQQSEQSATSSL